MTPDDHWKKYLELSDKLDDAEFRFAIAVLNLHKQRATSTDPVSMSVLAPLFFEHLETKTEMFAIRNELIEKSRYLDSIGFCP